MLAGRDSSMPLSHPARDVLSEDCTANTEFSYRSWSQRVVGGVARRLRRQVLRWRGTPAASAETAMAWWLTETRLPAPFASDPPSPPTAAHLEVATGFGQRKLAGLLAEWALSICRQDPDQQTSTAHRVSPHSAKRSGPLLDDAGLPSLLRTGDALAALLTWLDSQRGTGEGHPNPANVERVVASLCQVLVQHVGNQGELVFPATSAPLDRLGPLSLHLPWAAALLSAAERLGQPAWKTASRRIVANFKRRCDLRRWQAPLHLVTPGILALVGLGEEHLAAEALRFPQALQRSDGSVPATPTDAWVSLPGVAQLARAWYALGDAEARQRADAALAWLRRHQMPDGSLPGSYGPGACYHAGQPFVPAVMQFLLASQAQVHAAFAAGESDFPGEIAPADGRWLAVLRWANQLPTGAHVADVGCGRGRYLRRLQAALPHLRLTGIDLSESDLRGLPQGVQRRTGHLLDLPAADGEFDAVLCVEAVEHALVPQTACDELCRVLRPGGSLLVIDKDRRRQALSECAPWERWLEQEETIAWLQNQCDDITCTAIGHGPHSQFAGLFMAFEAVRRGNAVQHVHRRAA